MSKSKKPVQESTKPPEQQPPSTPGNAPESKPPEQSPSPDPVQKAAATTKELPACPCCGSPEHEVYKTRNVPRLRRTIRYCTCADCGTRFRYVELLRRPPLKPSPQETAS